jgi:hypothetical protein
MLIIARSRRKPTTYIEHFPDSVEKPSVTIDLLLVLGF